MRWSTDVSFARRAKTVTASPAGQFTQKPAGLR
jgi:hypothetical protein